MLFNSPTFILLFLPATVGLYLLARASGRAAAMVGTMLAASFVFYGWWDWRFLPLLLGSIGGNFWLAGRVASAPDPARRRWLALGIALNLAVLGWFKYAMFVGGVIAGIGGWDDPVGRIVLPIGISFYTFKQIAYLVDVGRGLPAERNPVRYALFVGFFPDVIAGPLVHHREFTPQLGDVGTRPFLPDLALGLNIFTVGLAKKLLLADSFALIATPLFGDAADGRALGVVAGWAAATAYGLQIYFDFSGYSDMAIGLARIFGLKLPINFASPYRATSIVDFWRRWHITLSRFLRDYLYIPLGGNRCSPARRRLNVFLTMLVGGIWHGAGWTFVLWGALHGVMIVVAQAWAGRSRPLSRPVAQALTLTLVIIAWVPFRAADLTTALGIWGSLAGFHGWGTGALPGLGLPGLLVGLAIVLLAPNTQTLFQGAGYGLATKGYATGIGSAEITGNWRPSLGRALVLGALLGLCLLKLNDVSEFIYFQF